MLTRLLSCTILAWLLFSAGFAAEAPRPEADKAEQKITDEILKLEKMRVAAMLAQDASVIQNLFSEKYIQVTSYGELRNKTHILNGLRSKSLKYDSIDLSDIRVTTVGDTAVMTGRSVRKGREKTRDLSGTFRVIRTWVKEEDGQWRLLAQQSTLVDKKSE